MLILSHPCLPTILGIQNHLPPKVGFITPSPHCPAIAFVHEEDAFKSVHAKKRGPIFQWGKRGTSCWKRTVFGRKGFLILENRFHQELEELRMTILQMAALTERALQKSLASNDIQNLLWRRARKKIAIRFMLKTSAISTSAVPYWSGRVSSISVPAVART